LHFCLCSFKIHHGCDNAQCVMTSNDEYRVALQDFIPPHRLAACPHLAPLARAVFCNDRQACLQLHSPNSRGPMCMAQCSTRYQACRSCQCPACSRACGPRPFQACSQGYRHRRPCQACSQG
jgi:hypothetical protein